MEQFTNITDTETENNNLTNPNQKDIIFALDIGTRCIVGVVGYFVDSIFHVLDFEQHFHSQRAMRDGQIENIEMVAKTANNVKHALEQRLGFPLHKVCVAAAGRSLKTIHTSFEQDIDETQEITQMQLNSIEYSAIGTALEQFTEDSTERYYCVGYSVTSYCLDDYSFSSLVGHKGSNVKINLIAAFLPHHVVESLYTVTRMCNLEVDNLTLEPIAAINLIVPADIRLLNIAIVDIGAGTSDIAISKNGSIAAYDMATTAGDEITEALMHAYIIDFETAENIKIQLSLDLETISFKDILGNAYNIPAGEIIASIHPAITELAECIAKRIIDINSVPPVAVFLVGGGSQVSGLTKLVAANLNLPESRVAIGGNQPHKNVVVNDDRLLNPEFITPIGIGLVSASQSTCDFFSITVNDFKVMMLSHHNAKVLDAILLAGIKPAKLIGISPRSMPYMLNGVKRSVKGTSSTPGAIYVNGQAAAIDTPINPGDKITTVFAKDGAIPELTIADILQDYPGFNLNINGENINISHYWTVNGESKDADYVINSMDDIIVITLDTVDKVADFLGLDLDAFEFRVNGIISAPHDTINNNDVITTSPKSLPDAISQTMETPKITIPSGITPNPVAIPETEVSEAAPEKEEYKEEEQEAPEPIILDNNIMSLFTAQPEIKTMETPVTPSSSAEELFLTNPDFASSTHITDHTPTIDFSEGFDILADDMPEMAPPTSGRILNININGTWQEVPLNGKSRLYFVDMLNYVEIDTKNPQGNLVLELNGIPAAYMDAIKDGDTVEIGWR